MANYPLTKTGLSKLRSKLEHRVTAAQREAAIRVNLYLLNFGYHAVLPSGPGGKNGNGWSCYYAANWNCTVNGIDRSVLAPARSIFDAGKDEYAGDLYEKQSGGWVRNLNRVKPGDVITVTNSVYYGRWLNDGGLEFLTFNTEASPNRFLELAEDDLRSNVAQVVSSAVMEVK